MVPAVWYLPCPVPCPALPASAAPTFQIQGTQCYIADPLSLFLFLQPFPYLHLLKHRREKKNCENGMLTDKPTQLSEASMSVFWMFLFTS